MASALSDDELRRKLQELGEIVGPITRTTRKVWEKKLEKAMQEQKKNSRHTITRSNASHLGHFSSDESEDGLCTETSLNHRHRYRRRTIGLNQPSDNSPYQYGSNIDDINFKTPGTVTRTLSEDTSKSNKSPSLYTSGLTRPSVRTTQRFSCSRLNSFDIDSSDSDVGSDNTKYSNRRRMHSEKTSRVDGDISSKSRTDSSNFIKKDEQFHNGSRRDTKVSTGLNHISPKPNGYAGDDNILWNTFKSEDDSRTSTNHSQISMFLVIGTALFFVIVGIIYVGVKQKDQLDQNHYAPPCEEENKEQKGLCRERKQAEALKIAGKLYTILTEATGEYQCNEGLATPRLPRKDVEFVLKKQEGFENDAAFEKNLKTALQMIVNNSEWGIKLYDKSDSIITDVNDLHDIHALEAVIASKSLRCRLREAFLRSSLIILYCTCGIVIIPGTIYFIKQYKKRKLLEEKKMYTIVESIIDVLKQQYENCQGNPDCEPVLAIAHVRDMLIPPAERKVKQQLWEKAVKFLEENESRVRVECQNIAGEKHYVWRWLQPSTPEVGGKYGKVWQGQAFGNTGKGINSPPYSPTPCLKIRNMFDPEVEYGDDWQVFIKDAILEKCENNNNIVHIKVDVSSNEGCVYLKCTTPEAAGQAFRALHGWWFDRKLVTVKYLRLERYHERFPESKYCSTPLKPSNNMRLSLSAPFHSSALESS